jgi:Ca-activated chloride channel homolog
MAGGRRCAAARFRIVAVACAIVFAAAIFATARAEAGSQNPPLIVPGSQGSGSSTLELPAMPHSQGGTSNIPPQVPQPGAQELILPSRQLREQPGYSQVTVTVTEPSGRYVTNLTKDDFRLELNGHERPVQFFRQDLNTPLSVGILVDTSGSMGTKLVQARIAIAEFLRDLNDRDDVFLIAFAGRPYLLQPFTTDHLRVLHSLELLRAMGQTALFDAILDGLQMVQHGRYDKKALLVVTDGMDNSSVKANLNDVVSAARQTGVLVYSIGIGNPNPGVGGGLKFGPLIIPFGAGDIDSVDTTTLRTLSKETGAKTYLLRRVGDGDALRKYCAEISLELREQYTLGFVAPDASAGGYRTVHVAVPTHPGVTARVRKGVAVGSASSYVANPGGP